MSRHARRWRVALAAILLPGLAFAQDSAPADVTVRLPDIDIIGSTPLLGSGVDRSKVPAATQVLTDQDVNRTGIANLTDALTANIPGISTADTSGNIFQPSILFRGFNASPIEGDSQGLAVYVNGARFNEPFGETVNWDLIPANAIARVNVESSNPVFGLNALGGSVSVQLKNGFIYHGGEAIAYGGSYGRAGASLQYGRESNDTSAYIAASVTHDDGWRATSGSDLRQVYADLGWRSDRGELHVNLTGADNDLNNPGASPVQLLAVDRSAAFTAPNVVHNRYLRLTSTATYDITDQTSLQGVLYYANLSQRLVNGVTVDLAPCGDGTLCEGDGVTPLTTRGGAPIADFLNGGPYSGLSRQATDSNAYGGSLQASTYDTILGHTNHLVGGLSYDGSFTMFDGSELLGGLNSARFFTGPGVLIDQADLTVAPVRLRSTTNNEGLFYSDSFDITERLALTLTGRLNVAGEQAQDQLGAALNGNNTFVRFNPGAGLTWRISPALSVFASYSEANRAPTPTELSCASITQACQLPNFFLADPSLKQVVAHSWEAGLRGQFSPFAGGRVQWNADMFRTDSDDDIIFVASQVPGLDYFTNAGRTRRQGVEANITLRTGRLHALLGYSYVEATFQSPLLLDSPLNPNAGPNGQEQVQPGNRIPGVPAHRLKAVVSYNLADAWTVGGAVIASSGQYLFGDEANLTKPLPGYVVLNLNTAYRITPNIQLFALATNVLNAKYATYGTFAPTASVPIAQVPGASDTRGVSPAPPVAAYGGVRVTF